MNSKPGWQTTEFWLTLATQFVAVCVTLGWVPVGDVEAIKGDVAKVVAGAVAAVSLTAYVWSRVRIKKP